MEITLPSPGYILGLQEAFADCKTLYTETVTGGGGFVPIGPQGRTGNNNNLGNYSPPKW